MRPAFKIFILYDEITEPKFCEFNPHSRLLNKGDSFPHLKNLLCKVVIYNYVFVGFYFVPNLIVIMFNILYPVFIVRFICKDCVCERESVKTQGKLKIEMFLRVARE